MYYKIVKHEPISAEAQTVNETWKTRMLPNARQVFNAGTANKGKILLPPFSGTTAASHHLPVL
jgi:hypothetical protein